MKIFNNIRKYREKLFLTPKELATILNVTQSTIVHWEQQKNST